MRNDTLCLSDSGIENCKRIFWAKNDLNVAKEAGYSHPGQEEVVINSLHALSFREGSEGRKARGEIRKVCQ